MSVLKKRISWKWRQTTRDNDVPLFIIYNIFVISYGNKKATYRGLIRPGPCLTREHHMRWDCLALVTCYDDDDDYGAATS